MEHPIETAPRIVRTAAMVQYAHDVLESFVLDELPYEMDATTRRDVMAALSVLCWLLGHATGSDFVQNLRQMTDDARAHGYALRPLVPPKEAN